MRCTLSSLILATVLTLPALHSQSQTYTGKLLDADCKADDRGKACPVLPTSKMFGIETPDGKYLKLDGPGNDSVLVAIRKVRERKGDILRVGIIEAAITGRLDGDTIRVESAEVF